MIMTLSANAIYTTTTRRGTTLAACHVPMGQRNIGHGFILYPINSVFVEQSLPQSMKSWYECQWIFFSLDPRPPTFGTKRDSIQACW
jgi:hypothetical protein